MVKYDPSSARPDANSRAAPSQSGTSHLHGHDTGINSEGWRIEQ